MSAHMSDEASVIDLDNTIVSAAMRCSVNANYERIQISALFKDHKKGSFNQH